MIQSDSYGYNITQLKNQNFNKVQYNNGQDYGNVFSQSKKSVKIQSSAFRLKSAILAISEVRNNRKKNY
jgi:hypothetical protein